MATQNNRDVSLKLLVDVIGQDGVDKLRTAMDALGKEGASAAPEVKKLTDQIDLLANQAGAVSALQALGDEAQALAAKEAAAATSLEKLKVQLDAQRESTDAARATQLEANAAVVAAQKAYNETAGDIRLLKIQYDAVGKTTDEFKTALAGLTTTQVQQRNAIIDARVAQTAANATVSEAVSAQGKLQAAQAKAASAAQAAADAVSSQAGAFAQAQASAAALGVTTTNLAQVESNLASQIRTTVASTEARVAAIREAAEADRLLAIEEQGMLALLQEGATALQAEVEAQRDAARGALTYATNLEKAAAAQRAAQAAQDAAAESKREQAESDRLAIIQLEALSSARKRGQAALEAENAAQRDAAAATQAYEARLGALAQAERDAAAAATAAAQQIADSFQSVGVRSVAAVREEIDQIKAGMAVLGTTAGVTGAELTNAFAAGASRIAVLEREIRGLTGQLTLADRAADLFKNSLGQIAGGNIIADGVGYLVNKVKELGREFIEVSVQTERTRKGLQAVYKDSTIAGQQFQFLRDTANQAGFSISASSDAFLRFSAATKGANLPLSVTNDLFASVTRAGTTLGLSNEAVTGTLDALGQMASKGVVQMEELRGQLGDRLPGALGLAAKGLGITEQQLIKLVESGQLATKDFFPALATALKTMGGDTDTLAASFSRFSNLFTEFTTNVNDAGGLQVLKAGITALTVVVGVILVPLQGFVEFLGLAGKAIGLFIGALTTGDYKGAFAEFGKELEASGQRIQKFQNTIDQAVNGTEKQSTAINNNAVAMAKGTSGTLGAIAAQERLGSTVSGTNNSFIAQIVKLQEGAVATEAAIQSSEKLLKAKEDEGKALVATATLTGSASKALDANAIALTANVAASEQVVAARQREVNITQQSIALINQRKNAQGLLDSGDQQRIDKLNATLIVEKASLEQAQQTTTELGRQALAAQTAADAYADNSTKIQAYQQSMTNAQTEASILTGIIAKQELALGDLKDELERGRITQETYDKASSNLAATKERLNVANGNAARYENLYRDAVADSVAAIDRKARADEASLSVSEALAKAQQAHYETLARQATALGQEAQATYYTIEAKKKQIEAIRLSIQIKNLELDADKAGIEIQIAALDPQDKLYEQKKKELEIRLELIKVKQIEAGAQKEVIQGIEDEITALRLRNEVKGGSVNVIGNPGATGEQQSLSSTDRQISVNGAGAPAPDNKKSGSAPSSKAGAPAPAPSSPFSFSAGGDLQTRTGIANFLRSAGVKNEADVQRIVGEFSDRKGNIPYANNPGQKKYADGGTISQALLKAAEAVTFDGKGAKTPAVPAAAPAASPGPAAAPAPSSSGTKTIILNINGRQTPVNVASDADAANLTSALRALESASGTAS